MTPDDEAELHRLSELLRTAYNDLPPNVPEREAVVKAGLALTQVFLHGDRAVIEEWFASLAEPLTGEDMAHIRNLAPRKNP